MDGYFKRAGIWEEKIYPICGDLSHFQCTSNCGYVFNSRYLVEKLVSKGLNEDGVLSDSFMIPTCPNCGSSLMWNVRTGWK